MCYTQRVGGINKHVARFPIGLSSSPTPVLRRLVRMTNRKPRVNVVVTQEQHDLLLELASLDPSTRSASSFVRQMIDQVTPLLRATVPMMRAASEEMRNHSDDLDLIRQKLHQPIANFTAAVDQLDLLDISAQAPARTERSDGARTQRKPRASNMQGQ